MKRRGLFSPIGLGLALVLFLGLGFSLWRDRGLAFSPGPVTGKNQTGTDLQGYFSHADFETQCGLCHDPLRTTLAEQCMKCHTYIADQINGKIQAVGGVHGKIANVGSCQTCHPEHRGREFDPTQSAYELFDHEITSFSLIWHQIRYDTTSMSCLDCHLGDDFSGVSNQNCINCHQAHDVNFMRLHRQDFGEDCLACHDGHDAMMNFDHTLTSFSLEGGHNRVTCTGCHQGGLMAGTPTSCESCHQEPEIHLGFFEPNCQSCHTPIAWSPAQLESKVFDHADNTRFSLVLHKSSFDSGEITCQTCHIRESWAFGIETCFDCHTTDDNFRMTEHREIFGEACLACHDGVDRFSNFNHEAVFPLDGAHQVTDCEGCHRDKIFQDTPTECSQCHAEPEIHAGIFGFQCQYCHDTQAWKPAVLLEHTFPLDHGETGLLECLTCHADDYATYTCYGCHEHDPSEIEEEHVEEGISLFELTNCASCHPQGLEDEAD
jgi:hypothetical protein